MLALIQGKCILVDIAFKVNVTSFYCSGFASFSSVSGCTRDKLSKSSFIQKLEKMINFNSKWNVFIQAGGCIILIKNP